MRVKQLINDFIEHEKTIEKYVNKTIWISGLVAFVYGIIFISVNYQHMTQPTFYGAVIAVPVLIMTFVMVGVSGLIFWSMLEVIKIKLTQKFNEVKLQKQLVNDVPNQIEQIKSGSITKPEFDKMFIDIQNMPPEQAIQHATSVLSVIVQSKIMPLIGSTAEIIDFINKTTCTILEKQNKMEAELKNQREDIEQLKKTKKDD